MDWRSSRRRESAVQGSVQLFRRLFSAMTSRARYRSFQNSGEAILSSSSSMRISFSGISKIPP